MPKGKTLVDLDKVWEEHNSKLNTIIGKLTGAMVTRNPLVKGAHQDLIDFAIWFDEQMEGVEFVEESEPSGCRDEKAE